MNQRKIDLIVERKRAEINYMTAMKAKGDMEAERVLLEERLQESFWNLAKAQDAYENEFVDRKDFLTVV